MNRREALQSGLGLLAATGISGAVSTIDADAVAVVLTLPHRLTSLQRDRMRSDWKSAMGNKAIPLVILENGSLMQPIVY